MAKSSKSFLGRLRSFTEGESSRLARRVVFAFVLTFIASRALVFLIMSRRLPMLFLNVRGTHVHHLNYGIVLLTVIGGFLLFARPKPVAARRAAPSLWHSTRAHV